MSGGYFRNNSSIFNRNPSGNDRNNYQYNNGAHADYQGTVIAGTGQGSVFQSNHNARISNTLFNTLPPRQTDSRPFQNSNYVSTRPSGNYFNPIPRTVTKEQYYNVGSQADSPPVIRSSVSSLPPTHIDRFQNNASVDSRFNTQLPVPNAAFINQFSNFNNSHEVQPNIPMKMELQSEVVHSVSRQILDRPTLQNEHSFSSSSQHPRVKCKVESPEKSSCQFKNKKTETSIPVNILSEPGIKIEKSNLASCRTSGTILNNFHNGADESYLRGPLDIDLPSNTNEVDSLSLRLFSGTPVDTDLPNEEVKAFMLQERSKKQVNTISTVGEPISATSEQVPTYENSNSILDNSLRLSPIANIQNSGTVIQNGESCITDQNGRDLSLLLSGNNFNCDNINPVDLFENRSYAATGSAIIQPNVSNVRFYSGIEDGQYSQQNMFSSVTPSDTGTSVHSSTSSDNGPRRNHIDSANNSFDSGSVPHTPRVESSPERKYLHLISDRLLSKSPEREFLESISSTRYSTSSRSRRSRSRSRSLERIARHSRSPVRSRFQKQSVSPKRRDSRYGSRSPERFRYARQRSTIRKRSRSRSPYRKKYYRGPPTSSDQNQRRVQSPSNVSVRTSCSRASSKAIDRASSKEIDKVKNRFHSNDKKFSRDSSRSEVTTDSTSNKKKPNSEREELLMEYRKDYCSDVKEMEHKMSKLDVEDIMKKEARFWIRMSPANLYYKTTEVSNVLEGTPKLLKLCSDFEDALVKRADRVRATQPKYEPPVRKKRMKLAKHKSEQCASTCSSSDSDCNSSTDEEDCTMEELERKRNHPYRLHQELWFNDPGEMNDGPLCRCSAKARRSGIRHNIYAGELNLPKCDINLNNANRLHHYRITISPPTNFLIKTPTIITHDDHEFIFEGFSMFSHIRLDKLPVCKVIRFNIEYTILYFEEKMPENFTIRELDLFYEYLFKEILELVDLDFRADGDKTRCAQFHFMPRIVRELPENGKELLSMNEVLSYLLKNSDDLILEEELNLIENMPQYEWQKKVDLVKGMVVTRPGMKPCSLRVDQLDRDKVEGKTSLYPEIVHFGIRPPQLSYAGNPEYQKAWREYVKFRHLLANMPKPSFEDKRKLEVKENKLQEMRTQSKMKRDVTVTVNSKGFNKTGIMCDIVQHAMLIPVLVSHLRFHCSLGVLEGTIGYKFENRFLLQLALTHPSYRENFGTNPDHARNSLTNCGIRQPEYGDRRIHYMNTRKRGINTLINIMSRFGKKTETESNITHNERLEFLGDAVVEFITSIHLFHMFPDLEEGGLATYRAAIVQNQHLAVLAKTLKLDEFMLYAHGSDLCRDLELRHAMANCFEALMGALFLDGGIEVADKVFGETLFKNDKDLLDVWVDYPPHPLQEQEPLGDRRWIPKFELLQKLTKFEKAIGIEFSHIRLLARAFTDRSIGYTNLTLGSNQRLEFLGDTVLQLIASEYLYKYFPEHHEGHLSLLRSSLVNNRTQSVVCNDLGMTEYALSHNPTQELKTKDKADLLEAFLGALYVDKGLEYCEVFCNVCFFPRLQTFIMKQDWNDPKSKLQQCCLTLRTMEGGEPEIPIYKVIQCMGPTNTRIYTVAVYFKGRRLAKASGHSIQHAEMNAAKNALQKSQSLFPQLDHQKRVIAKSLKSHHPPRRIAGVDGNSSQNSSKKRPLNKSSTSSSRCD